MAQELEPLNAQIAKGREQLQLLEGELHAAEAELETYSTEQQRFDALREVCDALDRLGALEAGDLFWDAMPAVEDAAGQVNRLRERVAGFEGEIHGVKERRQSLQAQVDLKRNELDCLYEEVHDAYAREERRQEEFVVEREISPVSYRPTVMPWSGEKESERRFRRSLAMALLWCLVFGTLIPMVAIPVIDRMNATVEIPERLAMLVKKEPIPEPLPPRPPEEKKPEPDEKKPKTPETEKKQQKPVTAEKSEALPETKTARKKAENTGVLAFKNTFADLLDETPVAKLGAEARLSKDAPQPGQARAQRSLVSIQAQGGTSGGISSAGVSRNIGSGNADRLGGGGVGFQRIESAVAGLAEESRPLSDGVGPARTDEEIQIVFDRYKAALYRIYNTELRKDPTLRGKILLRITIQPGGEVSACSVESTDLASRELVAQIVARVERFNFGAKEDVPKTTILYPIDFLPAG